MSSCAENFVMQLEKVENDLEAVIAYLDSTGLSQQYDISQLRGAQSILQNLKGWPDFQQQRSNLAWQHFLASQPYYQSKVHS